jgi:threonine dehydrogenase-like Zn-dependent dehydrogenase
MKIIRLKEPGNLHHATAPSPASVQPGEALVRVVRIGVCGTDIHAFAGRQPFFSYPRILGHELGVEVIAIGSDVSSIHPGDRCAVEPYINCGSCIACRRGKQNCCTDLKVLGVHADGGMQEQFVVPGRKLHRSGTLSFDQLALVEPLSIGAHAVGRANIEKGECMLVTGAGPIGLGVIQFAKERGADIIVADINAARLDFCARQFGITRTIDASREKPIEALKKLTAGDLPTLVCDATGNQSSMNAAFDFPAHGGRIVFVGLLQGDVTFNDPNFHRREITHRARFDEAVEEFVHWTHPESGVIKGMIEL